MKNTALYEIRTLWIVNFLTIRWHSHQTSESTKISLNNKMTTHRASIIEVSTDGLVYNWRENTITKSRVNGKNNAKTSCCHLSAIITSYCQWIMVVLPCLILSIASLPLKAMTGSINRSLWYLKYSTMPQPMHQYLHIICSSAIIDHSQIWSTLHWYKEKNLSQFLFTCLKNGVHGLCLGYYYKVGSNQQILSKMCCISILYLVSRQQSGKEPLLPNLFYAMKRSENDLLYYN